MFIFAVPWLSVSVTDFGRAGIIGVSSFSGQPTILACTETCHEGGQGGHGFWLFLAEASREPFVADTVFEGGHGFGIWAIDDLVLLC
jgi:hypothetical protein